ncbi:MAG: cysteine desulfurase family protein [Alphaproteobacteria bacterium]
MKQKTYLDYNASAPMRPQVITHMSDIMQAPHNASAVHQFGRDGKRLIDTARRQIASITGADENNVIFNSGATEGNNTVLKHFAAKGRVLVSDMDHPSVLDVIPEAEKIPSLKSGLVNLAALEEMLKDGKTELVSVMLVNNETGIIQPIAEISKLAQRHGAFVHCDCTQALGRLALAINALGIHFMTCASHKIGGPQGVGALILGLCGETPVLLEGGGQEKRARSGTENVAGIAGFGLAAELAQKHMDDYQKLAQLRDYLENEMLKIHQLSSRAKSRDLRPESEDSSTSLRYGRNDEGLKFYGQDLERVPNTSMFSIPGTSSETMLMAFDLEGIALSNGSACSSGSVKASHVLKAMGASDEDASSALRVSLGWDSTQEDINAFLRAFEKIVNRL